MDEDTVIIKRAENGMIIKWIEVDDDDKSRMMRAVLEIPEDIQNEAEADAKLASKLCWWLIDHYGWAGNKYDTHRINIEITHNPEGN